MPCHHNLELALTLYVDGAELSDALKGPLFRTIGHTTGQLTRTPRPSPIQLYDRRSDEMSLDEVERI